MDKNSFNCEESFKLISRGVHEIIGAEEIKDKLAKGKTLVIKAGFDPTAPDIHIGHTVLLRKMKHFQEWEEEGKLAQAGNKF